MRQYEMFELTFAGTAPAGSEVAVDVNAVFTNGDSVTKVKGFYAGNGTYKVRFYPEIAGTYSWEVSGAVSGNGTEECSPAETGEVKQNGKWKGGCGIVRADGVHFKYADGNRYQPFGTTIYALVHQEKALIDQTMETLKKAPFNKVRFCMFPKHYDYNHNDPEYFAFEKNADGKWDVNRPCYAYWDALDYRIDQLGEMGIQGDVILFHPYDCWGFAELSEEECMTYLDYCMRRLAAYPHLWWSLANEYDLMKQFEDQWWYDFSAFIAENDPYHHLCSNHNCLPYWDFDDENTTHCCIQDVCVRKVPMFQTLHKKPVVFDEVCYEGDLQFPWGNISAFEMVDRFWNAVVMGGYCTHGEVFENEEEILWWSKGGELKGQSPERIGFLRSIVEELPGDLDSDPGRLSSMSYEQMQGAAKNPPIKEMAHFMRTMAKLSEVRFEEFRVRNMDVTGHCEDNAFIHYFGTACNGRGIMTIPEEGSYDVEVIDVWEMTRETVLRGVNGKVEVKLPGKPGMAMLAKR